MLNKIKIPSIIFVFVILLFGFYNSNSSDHYKKLKTFTELLRLINNTYVDSVNVDTIIDGAIVGMLNELDPHSNYIPSNDLEKINEQFDGKFEGIGIEFDILDNYITVISPISGTPSEKAGLISGDKIIKINNNSAYKITFDEVFKKLRGPKGSSVNLSIQRSGNDELIDVTIIRDEIPIFSVLAAFLIDKNTGYIKINRFASTTAQEFQNSMDDLINNGMENLILDLRNNGGGLMDEAIKILDLLISSNDVLLMTKGRIGGSTKTYYAHKQAPYNNIPIVIIINRGSASASEIVSGAIQDLDRGIVTGETSFGKGLVQRQYQLGDGSAARITIAKYYTPSGRLIQRDFDDTYEEYYTDLLEENREATDSTLSTKPVYQTNNGRVVYGGGGIAPDHFVPSQENLTEDTKKLLTNPDRIIFNYSNLIKNHVVNDFNDFNDFNKNYIINKSDFNDFIMDVKNNYDINTLSKDWTYIQNRIKSEVANSIWGKEYFYKSKITYDSQIKESLIFLEEAKKLINLY